MNYNATIPTIPTIPGLNDYNNDYNYDDDDDFDYDSTTTTTIQSNHHHNQNKEDSTLTYARQMEQKRNTRRKNANTYRAERHIENLRNIAEGRPGDVDFQRLVKAFRRQAESNQTQNKLRTLDERERKVKNTISKCLIFCRKRPVNERERKESDYDVVSCINETTIVVHFPRIHYNGVTKSIEHSPFQFNRVFNQHASNQDVYTNVCAPLVRRCLESGDPGLIFATGQTGSGKTYSLRACLELMARDIFNAGIHTILIQSFEVYGNTILDLLQKGNTKERRVHARSKGNENQNGGMALQGLRSVEVHSVREFLKFVHSAQRQRKTSATKKNSTSSRSHWIVNLVLTNKNEKLITTSKNKSSSSSTSSTSRRHRRKPSTTMKILSIVDLAGSERADDSEEHSPELMRESSKINQSLLSLKKVIVALSDMEYQSEGSTNQKMDQKAKLLHVFRGSKLTMVLRTFLLHPKCQVHVLCTVAPTASCAHHSVDTLRNAAQLQPNTKAPVDLSMFEELDASIPPPSRTQQYSSPNPLNPLNPPNPPPPLPSQPFKPHTTNDTISNPSPRKKKELTSLKTKLRLKLTGLDPLETKTDSKINHQNAPTQQWVGLSPTARSAAAASAQNRIYAQTYATMPQPHVHRPKPTPLLRSHGSMLMMMEKSPVLVAVRVRPLSTMELSRQETIALRVSSKSTLSLDLPNRNQGDPTSRIFSFDSCVPQHASQIDTYNVTGKMLLGKVLSGVNACLFCYGQTGAGKTHTLIGSQTDRGVLLEFVKEMFTKIDRETTIKVKVTMMEIYKEKLRDLLDPSRKPVIVGTSNGVHVKNVQVAEIQSLLDMERILWQGLARRVTGSTDMNKRSSRSHAIITLYVTQKNVKSKMIFVDLAGSERQERTGAAGKRLKEAASINKSLSALGNVILALVQGSDHVPYRSSVLTRLMQDCLGGDAATMLICNVTSGSKSIFNTLSSLRFADRVKHVKNQSNIVHQTTNSVTATTRTQFSQEDPRVPTLQAQVVALQRALLESQRENIRLKEEAKTTNTFRTNRVTEILNGWCPHCDGPLNGDVEV